MLIARNTIPFGDPNTHTHTRRYRPTRNFPEERPRPTAIAEATLRHPSAPDFRFLRRPPLIEKQDLDKHPGWEK